VFDEDVLREMEQHLDEVIGCVRDECGEVAAWKVATRCCGGGAFLCAEHYTRTRRDLGRAFASVGTAECGDCHEVTPTPATFDDIFRSVPL
jgi:hypothetical protein